MSEPAPEPVEVLRLEGLEKRFGAVYALSGVSFAVHRGTVTALVGDNGAGKSTTVKIVSGVEKPDGGHLHFEGAPVGFFSDPAEAAEHGIQTVYQDLALCDNLSIVANMYLGRERRSGPRASFLAQLSELDMEQEAGPVLDRLGIQVPPLTTPVASLSGGQRQAVAVARAVLWGSKLVIMDEPTAALGVAQTRMVLRLIQQLAHNGLAVIVISHNLQQVFEVSDHIVVLRQGKTVGDYAKGDVTPEQVVSDITGVSGGMFA